MNPRNDNPAGQGGAGEAIFQGTAFNIRQQMVASWDLALHYKSAYHASALAAHIGSPNRYTAG
jgi:hypothetical protein